MAEIDLNGPISRECRFSVGGLQIAAKRWGKEGGLPLLALHGWMDNCASMDLLGAELCDQFDMVALDLMGHGLSDHRGHLGAYNIWQDVIDVFSVADQLNWSTFNLLGHSRGAMVAFLCGGTFPNRIESLFMVEGMRPRLSDACDTPTILGDSIRVLQSIEKRKRQFYPSFDEAVIARVNGLVAVTYDDALALAKRGVAETEQGFYWRYDPKLIVGSEVRFTADQVDAFKQRLPDSKTLIVAESGLLIAEAVGLEWANSIKNLQIEYFSGGHHLHMHEQSRNIAALLKTRV